MRKIVEGGRGAYSLAADPSPPSSKFDPTGIQSRRTLLNIGIDIKYIVTGYMLSIPQERAETFTDWLDEPPSYTEDTLTDYQRTFLKWDIKQLRLILLDKKYW